MSQENSIFVYPVIHHLDNKTTIEQADLAFEAGADGVFLISHHRQDADLVDLGRKIKTSYPEKKVGLNFLSLGPVSALSAVVSAELDMMWGDDCGVTSAGRDELSRVIEEGLLVCDARSVLHGAERKAVFASVAFKYQAHEPDPARAAKNALHIGFVPTTSGEGTGSAPTVEKIRLMSEAVDGNLAVASGMTAGNIHAYAPFLRYVLVATGVSVDEHHFDFEELYRFIALAKKSKAEYVASLGNA